MKGDGFFIRNGVLQLRRLFLVVFLVEIGIFIAISSLSIHNQVLLSAFKNEQQSIVTLSLPDMILEIFPHNLLVATIEFIPVIGQLFFLLSSIETSIIISIEGTSLHTSGLVVFFSLAILPHTWLELPSYAVATSTSIYLIYLLAKRGQILHSNIMKVVYMYLFVVLELAIAGTFESTEIYMSRIYASPYNIEYPLMLWIAAVPVIYLLIRLYRRIDRDEYDRKIKNKPEDFTQF
ncbi:MAG: stage II sporulation protein M [Cuniculiplasma divulgatum]|nr:MAG: stage II sporulation protein M [Cuniculiplasma divulgatum]